MTQKSLLPGQDLSVSLMSWEEGEAAIAKFQRLFTDGAVDEIVECFTPNCLVRFSALAELKGREELHAFLTARFAKTENYTVDKYLVSLAGNMLASRWTATWVDADTKVAMTGRGGEFCVLEGDLVSVWEAYFNVWEVGKQPTVAEMLSA